jgi:phosphatidylserine/phosphatidylglycerophosphate/cardiolipin synthase-like enzyme
MKVCPHFTDIEQQICQYIDEADEVWICSAWFSSIPILDQASLRTAKLIISDWSRLSKGNPNYSPKLTREILQAIPQTYIYAPTSSSSSAGGHSSSAGGHPTEFLMHDKFIVLFQDQKPYAIITGSYNYTQNAKNNFENIVYIEDHEVAKKFANEFEKILSFSRLLK